MTIEELQEKFRKDDHWNTPNADGSHRFDKEIEWIGDMLREYASALGISEEEIVKLAESHRSYSWPNYYQPGNFPHIGSDRLYGVFRTYKEFHEYVEEHYRGFRCSACGDIGPSPQECVHRTKGDGKCNWCSYGLFGTGKGVIILENGLSLIQIFEPVPKKD